MSIVYVYGKNISNLIEHLSIKIAEDKTYKVLINGYSIPFHFFTGQNEPLYNVQPPTDVLIVSPYSPDSYIGRLDIIYNLDEFGVYLDAISAESTAEF